MLGLLSCTPKFTMFIVTLLVAKHTVHHQIPCHCWHKNYYNPKLCKPIKYITIHCLNWMASGIVLILTLCVRSPDCVRLAEKGLHTITQPKKSTTGELTAVNCCHSSLYYACRLSANSVACTASLYVVGLHVQGHNGAANAVCSPGTQP